jgi:E3 ubiquitin-protein ligase SIAH1
MEFEIIYSRYVSSMKRRLGDQLTDQYQRCKFRVASVDLSSGLPSPDDCFQFFVPTIALGEENKDTIQVNVRIFTSC